MEPQLTTFGQIETFIQQVFRSAWETASVGLPGDIESVKAESFSLGVFLGKAEQQYGHAHAISMEHVNEWRQSLKNISWKNTTTDFTWRMQLFHEYMEGLCEHAFTEACDAEDEIPPPGINPVSSEFNDAHFSEEQMPEFIVALRQLVDKDCGQPKTPEEIKLTAAKFLCLGRMVNAIMHRCHEHGTMQMNEIHTEIYMADLIDWDESPSFVNKMHGFCARFGDYCEQALAIASGEEPPMMGPGRS